MRVAIISDIHSNFVALETALAAMGSFDQLWNLGDTIGYGPQPNACMTKMRELAQVMIAGNHDLACIGRVDLSDFNADARTANIWNGEQLEPDHWAVLEGLPPLYDVDDRFMLAHGSPREPVWEYLLSVAQARANFELFPHQVCFIGHSHVPLVFREHPDGRCDDPYLPAAGEVLELKSGSRYMINPGSIGQPRDQDPRSAYALLDTDAGTIRFNRVEYDISRTQAQMREAALPTALIRRLDYGM
ncbi:MAG: metallophosphoesterase family protein [Blastochloris sp.]|nr:metallophosphoesterase family protein [Blastochloris sp.]